MTLSHDPARVAATALREGRCRHPFDVLGIHPATDTDTPTGTDTDTATPGHVVRAFVPWATSARVVSDGEATEMIRGPEGLFEVAFPDADHVFAYRLDLEDPEGRRWEVEDPYRFAPALDEARVHEFLEGRERRVHDLLGARRIRHEGIEGTLFAVWAPHAEAVNLRGDMNHWDGRCHPMRPRGATGVWELFLPGVDVGVLYKYEIVTRDGFRLEKADPCGRAVELRPATASEVWDSRGYAWDDAAWMGSRAERIWDGEAISVYEVHLGSWRRRPPGERAPGDPGWLTYRELAEQLVPYVRDLGFTHIELLPVMEHPLDQSWGYQPLGFFAPTSRFGTPDDFRYLVDAAHRAGLGVILDWVPSHFPEDAHGLVKFDGTRLYEHSDVRQAVHPDWGTLTFDLGKPQVRSFLISSALHWIEDYHVDGLRVDAVASMLYLDYSRREGEWTPNRYGGRENLEAISFLEELNEVVKAECPGVLMIAEESTAWPRVSHGRDQGGLGFDQKWNMGWMNDTLHVMSTDPLYRRYEYDLLSFSLLYAFSERFLLPLSHDEVVHGKRSLLGRMPGPHAERFGNLRLLLGYMWAHPGKKLLFMGGEFGQESEWAVDDQLQWFLLERPEHRGIQNLVRDLNRLYRAEAALRVQDYRPEGFEWLDCHDRNRVTISFIRWAPEWRDPVVVVGNFTPVPREDYRLAVPWPGRYELLLDTSGSTYGGEGGVAASTFTARPEELHGRDWVLDLPLPGLCVLYLKWVAPD
jgi:1,4-alpha-glucan branching enzyme